MAPNEPKSMQMPKNIKLPGLFQQSDGGKVTRLDGAFSPLQFTGTNVYSDIDLPHIESFELTGRALSENGDSLVRNLIADMNKLGVQSFYLNLGLEPKGRYPLVSTPRAKAFVTQLGKELKEYQQLALDNGADLDISVRYASEMNISTVYSAAPNSNQYKSTFATIHDLLKDENDSIRMAFSPALNFGTNLDALTGFYPGDNLVDLITCTWYINGDTPGTDPAQAISRMKKYFRDRKTKAKPFAFDEMGAFLNNSNDVPLQMMFEAIESLENELEFDYLTVFMQNASSGKGRYNFNPTLAFLGAGAVVAGQ